MFTRYRCKGNWQRTIIDSGLVALDFHPSLFDRILPLQSCPALCLPTSNSHLYDQEKDVPLGHYNICWSFIPYHNHHVLHDLYPYQPIPVSHSFSIILHISISDLLNLKRTLGTNRQCLTSAWMVFARTSWALNFAGDIFSKHHPPILKRQTSAN